jgi:hypothetical protein
LVIADYTLGIRSDRSRLGSQLGEPNLVAGPGLYHWLSLGVGFETVATDWGLTVGADLGFLVRVGISNSDGRDPVDKISVYVRALRLGVLL